MTPELTALHKAIGIAGGQTALAKLLAVRQQRVSAWVHVLGHVPVTFAAAVERAVDGQVSREELRPDVFRHVPG